MGNPSSPSGTIVIMPATDSDSLLTVLRQDFRHHLEQWYASLNLAPPYHSLEKAVRHLSMAFNQKSPDKQKLLAEDQNAKWEFYGQVFVESGLSQKHRGIIRGLVESCQLPHLPDHYKHFIKAFHSPSQFSG